MFLSLAVFVQVRDLGPESIPLQLLQVQGIEALPVVSTVLFLDS
jgi:hypothetical protein